MATPESEVDVLIIGAGPAGIMCANGLARAGVNVRIIDQRCGATSGRLQIFRAYFSRPVKISAGQADSVQPRTIEVLQVRLSVSPDLNHVIQILEQSYGLAERLLREGNQLHMAVRSLQISDPSAH